MLARAVNGRPVRLQWMRDDEFKWEPYGPAMTMKVKGAVAGGRVVDWAYDVWSQSHNMRPGDPDGINLLGSWYLADAKRPGPARHAAQPNGAGDRNAITLYDFPRQRTTHHLIMEQPVRTSALRTLGAYANVFAIESFMDELAAAAGIDPVAFRLAHIKDERERAVIEAVARAAAWKPGEKGDGRRGRGIGYARYKTVATYIAVIAEVEVDRATGIVKVPRIWTAADAGQIINPDGLTNQIEGGVIQSASWTLHEHVRFDRNGISVAGLDELSDPDHAGRAQGRDRADRPAERTCARCRRSRARADGGRHRQCVRSRDRQAHPRAAVDASTYQGRHRRLVLSSERTLLCLCAITIANALVTEEMHGSRTVQLNAFALCGRAVGIFHLGETAAGIESDKVRLKSGGILQADMVVVGVGVRPRPELAESVGLALDRGVKVNSFLETSAPGIFAAGDIARLARPALKGKHLRRALGGGRAAGAKTARNMLGYGEKFTDVPFFWSHHCDVPINYVGHAEKWDALEVEGDIAGRDCLLRFKRNGHVLAVGLPPHVLRVSLWQPGPPRFCVAPRWAPRG